MTFFDKSVFFFKLILFQFLGIGSNSSTPQRKDSFSDYSKHPQQPYGAMSQFYSSLGVSPNAGSGLGGMSPSPGPLSSLMHGHGLSSPPQSMSPLLGKLILSRIWSLGEILLLLAEYYLLNRCQVFDFFSSVASEKMKNVSRAQTFSFSKYLRIIN